mmetsp:Transcript_22989/g.47824  ORF Transcript_22989/g.47824 Transcript_22989/m.47824 type:complete len:256 (-) Transcript_22989:365-1132(-)
MTPTTATQLQQPGIGGRVMRPLIYPQNRYTWYVPPVRVRQPGPDRAIGAYDCDRTLPSNSRATLPNYTAGLTARRSDERLGGRYVHRGEVGMRLRRRFRPRCPDGWRQHARRIPRLVWCPRLPLLQLMLPCYRYLRQSCVWPVPPRNGGGLGTEAWPDLQVFSLFGFAREIFNCTAVSIQALLLFATCTVGDDSNSQYANSRGQRSCMKGRLQRKQRKAVCVFPVTSKCEEHGSSRCTLSLERVGLGIPRNFLYS